ncbi:MAG: enoyl-CoA hydratase/isomerase family protein [Acidobacteria bacterium]|nr:enoyl-CoA hydratase/isomerase family protein [Acidobacteriota bacterium]
MAYENLLVEKKDGVAIVTVNRPDKLNALNGRTIEELDAAFSALASDPEVRGVVVTGAGEKAFVAGADIEELSGLDAEAGRALSERGQRVFDRIEWLGKPVVAAVGGFALGGGCELALACHVRVASENASLGTPEVKLGLLCGYGGTQRLPRLVGRGAALEILLTGERVKAAEALRLGLVNRVVAREDLLAQAEALLRQMIANGPLALRATLEAVHGGLDRPLGEAQAGEAQLFGELCGTRDAREGTRAFLEKRAPRFEGR